MALVKIEITDLEGQFITYNDDDSFEFFAAYELPQQRAYYIQDGYTGRLIVPFDIIDEPYTWLDAHIRLIDATILVAHGLPEGQPNPNELTL
jgi:hypothetical protein